MSFEEQFLKINVDLFILPLVGIRVRKVHSIFCPGSEAIKARWSHFWSQSHFSSRKWDWDQKRDRLTFMAPEPGFLLPNENISLIWIRHNCRWRASKSNPVIGSYVPRVFIVSYMLWHGPFLAVPHKEPSQLSHL